MTKIPANIASPKQAAPWPDRALDCQFAIEEAFAELAERAEAAGWQALETAEALSDLAIARRHAIQANAETDAAVARAREAVRRR